MNRFKLAIGFTILTLAILFASIVVSAQAVNNQALIQQLLQQVIQLQQTLTRLFRAKAGDGCSCAEYAI